MCKKLTNIDVQVNLTPLISRGALATDTRAFCILVSMPASNALDAKSHSDRGE